MRHIDSFMAAFSDAELQTALRVLAAIAAERPAPRGVR
jgi:hypothetical protein